MSSSSPVKDDDAVKARRDDSELWPAGGERRLRWDPEGDELIVAAADRSSGDDVMQDTRRGEFSPFSQAATSEPNRFGIVTSSDVYSDGTVIETDDERDFLTYQDMYMKHVYPDARRFVLEWRLARNEVLDLEYTNIDLNDLGPRPARKIRRAAKSGLSTLDWGQLRLANMWGGERRSARRGPGGSHLLDLQPPAPEVAKEPYTSLVEADVPAHGGYMWGGGPIWHSDTWGFRISRRYL